MLSPGNGGEHYYDYGGGGGGVLVDNVGPSCNTYQGEGYGGGGGASWISRMGGNFDDRVSSPKQHFPTNMVL